MPTVQQNMFDDRTAEEGAKGGFGDASKKTLAKAFPQSAHHGDTKTGTYQTDVEMNVPMEVTREGLKNFYETEVMSGIKSYPGSDFSNVDLDYGTNEGTQLSYQPPDGAPTWMYLDNTISLTMLGPTVTTLDITQKPTMEAPGNPTTEPSSQVPNGAGSSKNSQDTSAKISAGGIHGGTPSESGILGESLGDA